MKVKRLRIENFNWGIISVINNIVLGFFYGVYLSKNNQIIKYPIIIIAIISIFIIYLSTFIHELGHLIIIKLLKNEIDYISFGALVFYKVNNKFKFKFRKYNLLGTGNIICNSYKISCEEKLEEELKNFKLILIGGPILTIILLISSLIALIFDINNFFIHLLIFINLNNFINSIISKVGNLGDIYIILNKNEYKKILVNYFFMLGVSLNKLTDYMYDYIKEKIFNEIKYNNIEIDTLTIVNQFLQYNIKNKRNYEHCEIIIEYFKKNFDILSINKSNTYKVRLHLIIHSIIEYQVKIKKDILPGNLLFDRLKNDKETMNLIQVSWMKYFAKKSEHILQRKDNSKYLNNKFNADKANFLLGIKI